MSTSARTFERLPGVLSFQRGVVISDAPFFNVFDDDRSPDRYRERPVSIIRHGLRGTQNVAEGAGSAEKGKERDPSNIQETESAKLEADASGFAVEFAFRTIGLKSTLHACATSDVELRRGVRASIVDFCERATGSGAVREVALRYARNVANGRWLWRNRVVADGVDIVVRQDGETLAEFDALSISMDHFDDPSDAEERVADVLAAGMAGERSGAVDVTAFISFGARGSTELFPSQNYLPRRVDGFARSLYKLPGSTSSIDRDAHVSDVVNVGTAALRDQKIGNAIRTIDTWYEQYDAIGRPIPIEPNGASLEMMEFFRTKEATAFKLMRRLAEIDPTSDEGLYMIGVMMRGGVINGTDKVAEKQPAEAAAS